MIVDTHCHLDYPGVAEDEAGVVARAAAAGVTTLVTIATRQAAWAAVVALTERHSGVFCALGIHPHEAGNETLDDAGLTALAEHPKVVAVGETGLDHHYDLAPRDAQAASFRRHIAVARATGLPLVVHTREADAATMDILEAEMAAGPFGGVIHCYSSGPDLARRAVAIGLHLGLGGMLTFKRADAIRETVAAMPLERLVLETDAPYLAPVPYRGRTNEPAYVALVAAELAKLRGLSLAEVAAATTANARALFPKLPRDAGAA